MIKFLRNLAVIQCIAITILAIALYLY